MNILKSFDNSFKRMKEKNFLNIRKMPLYYEDFIDNKIVKIPITINDIKRILNECKIIDIEAKEPFPKGEVTFVGVGNDNYECRTLWDIVYTDHMKLTYGGYFHEDHNGYYNVWRTMNYNYSDKYDKTKAYIVNNSTDGHKLAKFLNFIKGFKNLENTILNKENEIQNLQDEIFYLNEAKTILSQYT